MALFELNVVGRFGRQSKQGWVRVEIRADKYWYSLLGNSYVLLLLSKALLVHKNLTFVGRNAQCLIKLDSVGMLKRYRYTSVSVDRFLKEVDFALTRAYYNLRFHYPFVRENVVDKVPYRSTSPIDENWVKFMYGKVGIVERTQGQLTFLLSIDQFVITRLGTIESIFGESLNLNILEDGSYQFTLPNAPMPSEEFLFMVGELISYEISEALNEAVEHEWNTPLSDLLNSEWLTQGF